MNITQEIIERAKASGYEVQTSEDPEYRGSIVNVKVDNANDVVNQLQNDGYILDMRSNGVRLAPHFFNNSTDIANLFDKIDQLCQN